MSTSSIVLTSEQEVTLTAAFRTEGGNLARVDGRPVWTSLNLDVVSLRVAADGLSAVAVSGVPGTAQITCKADANLGPGVRTITGTFLIEVREAEAVRVELTAGAPVFQKIEAAFATIVPGTPEPRR